jgi:hypothetical protein
MKTSSLPACMTHSSALVEHPMVAIFCSNINTVIHGCVNYLPISDAHR